MSGLLLLIATGLVAAADGMSWTTTPTTTLHTTTLLTTTVPTTTIPMTTPWCWDDSGSPVLVNGRPLKPGERVQPTTGPDSCIIFECDEQGNAQVMHADFLQPMCVDPVWTNCAVGCPNDISTTTPLPTTTPTLTPPCLDHDGNPVLKDNNQPLEPGDSLTQATGDFSCVIYECDRDGQLQVLHGDGFPAMCVDAHHGSCGLTCPNGDNCRLPSGEIMAASEERVVGNQVCRCPQQIEDIGLSREEHHYTAICEDQTSLTVHNTKQEAISSSLSEGDKPVGNGSPDQARRRGRGYLRRQQARQNRGPAHGRRHTRN